MGSKMLEFTGIIRIVGTQACFINVDGVSGWVPDSKADYIDEPEEKQEIRFLIPEWLAEKKGWI